MRTLRIAVSEPRALQRAAVAALVATLPGMVLAWAGAEVPGADVADVLVLATALLPAASVDVLPTVLLGGDVALALAALAAGALGWVMLDAEPEALAEGIRAAARLESFVTGSALQALSAEHARRRHADQLVKRLASLTTRERAVVAGIVHGLPAAAVGAALGVSGATIRTYRARARRKLGDALGPEELAALRDRLAPPV